MKKHWANVAFLFCLCAFTLYLALDTFVIVRVLSPESSPTATQTPDSSRSTDAPRATEAIVSTDTEYHDDQIDIVLTTLTVQDTTIYAADITLRDGALLKAALAGDTYARNMTETTSTQAERVGAILAINGDYYGAQEHGYVLRNGTLYRSSAKRNTEALVIDRNGLFSIVTEGDVSAESLAEEGAWQIFSFGPALVVGGEIVVSKEDEVGRAMTSNPRTAIGQIGENHYLFVVSDGRTEESSGLSLQALAEVMQSLGAQTAYNLDGGGSSTMVFQGRVINNPTTNGRKIRERSVSDIVYIGY